MIGREYQMMMMMCVMICCRELSTIRRLASRLVNILGLYYLRLWVRLHENIHAHLRRLLDLLRLRLPSYVVIGPKLARLGLGL